MGTNQSLIAQAYVAFNLRDTSRALALMTENVSWPKASEGGRAEGKQEIRFYWSRQWEAFDPKVYPLEFVEQPNGIIDVKVHQVVQSIGGELLFDGEVWHSFTIAHGLIERMDLKDNEATVAPSSAFAKR